MAQPYGFRALTERWRPTSRDALGEDPATMMDEMGHADPGLPLRVYPACDPPTATTKKAAPRALGSALSLV